MLHSNKIGLHSQCKFKDSPIYYCARSGKLDILKYIVTNERGILIKTTGGDIGTCPKVEYTDIWAGLTKIARTEDKIVIGKFNVCCIRKSCSIIQCFLAMCC